MLTTDQATSLPAANSNSRALIPVGPKGVELRDIDAMFRFARCYLQSGLAPASFKNEQQLVIAWAKAAELGLSPLQAVEGMTIINNRVGIMGDLALAMVEASGLLEQKRVEYSGEGESLVCQVTLQRKGREPQVYSFSVREARAAGIYERSPTWRNYPRRMTYYRALGFGLRDEFSDVLKGTKTVEELQDYPIEEPREQRRVRATALSRNARTDAAKGEAAQALTQASEQPFPQSEALTKIRKMLEFAKMSESDMIAVLKAAQIKEALEARSLAEIPDAVLRLAIEDWAWVETVAEQLKAKAA
jgi:hypothetical protein